MNNTTTSTTEINKNQEKKYLIINETLNSISHGIGFGLSIAALIILIIFTKEPNFIIKVVSFSIYGSTMILLFLFSTLYHSLTFTRAKKIMRILDHASIYIFIAGSYTAISPVIIGGTFGWILCIIVWIIAVVGVVLKFFYIGKKDTLSLLLYIAMGWLCVLAIKPLYRGFGKTGFFLFFSSGLAYTVGAIFYSLDRIKYMHFVWHLFVMSGVSLMYFAILLHVA